MPSPSKASPWTLLVTLPVIVGVLVVAVFGYYLSHLLAAQTEAMKEALALVAAHGTSGQVPEEGDRGIHPHTTTLHTGSLASLRDTIWEMDKAEVRGDWVEIGAWRGGISAAAIVALQSSPHPTTPRRRVLLCDTWEEEEGLAKAEPPLQAVERVASEDRVVLYLRGKAQQTIPSLKPRVAMAWVDVKTSRETREVLSTLLPYLNGGAKVMVPLLFPDAVDGARMVLGTPDGYLPGLAMSWEWSDKVKVHDRAYGSAAHLRSVVAQ